MLVNDIDFFVDVKVIDIYTEWYWLKNLIMEDHERIIK